MGPLNPGVHGGSREIRTIGEIRPLGKRHSAVAMVDRSGKHRCVELVGPPTYWRSRTLTRDRPFYSSWSMYRRAQVAPVTGIGRMEVGIRVARLHDEGYRYAIADSNRFVGMALRHARIALDWQARYRVGDAPALHDYPGI